PDDARSLSAELDGRVIDQRSRLCIETDMAHVTGDADNRAFAVAEAAQDHGLPNRVLIGPELPGHRPADDGRVQRALAIIRREVPASQWNTHRGEVVRADDAPAGGRIHTPC